MHAARGNYSKFMISSKAEVGSPLATFSHEPPSPSETAFSLIAQSAVLLRVTHRTPFGCELTEETEETEETGKTKETRETAVTGVPEVCIR